METVYRSRRLRVALGLGCLAGLAAAPAVHAQGDQGAPSASAAPATNPQPARKGNEVADALANTAATGQPTVVMVTSAASPDTRAGWLALQRMPRYAALARQARFVELSIGSDATSLARAGVKVFPAIRVYRKGAAGIEMAAGADGLREPYALIGWLSEFGIDGSASARDAGLLQAEYQNPSGQSPSPQQPFAPPSKSPPQQAPPQQAPPQMMVPVTQTYSAPPLPPVVLSAPSAPVIFQPQAPNIVIGPTPPPNIYIASAPSAAPNITMMSPPPAANPPQLMFAPAAPPAAPPAPAPAAAPGPQAGVGTAALGYILTNPGFIDRILGMLGRLLAERANPRIQMAPAAPATYGAPQQMIAAPAYIAQPVQSAAAAPPAYLLQENAPPPAQKVEVITASPQCSAGTCGHSFHGGRSAGPSPTVIKRSGLFGYWRK